MAIWIDPYNIIHKEYNPNINEKKLEISLKINPILYKLQRFKANPTDAIIIGDSRMNALPVSKFEELTHKETTNLSIGGGTLPEIIETFWYVAQLHKLKEVYIGINFNLYNEHNRNNRVKDAIILVESPISYLFSKYCYEALFLIIKSSITNKSIKMGVPSITREAFWKYQLENSKKFYALYKYPYSFEKSLMEISNYCKANNIKLVFCIPPTHIDLEQSIIEFHLEKEQGLFKSALFSIGSTFDFDYPNEITQNNSNFSDPFHFKDSISTIIIKEIAANNIDSIKYARTNNVKK